MRIRYMDARFLKAYNTYTAHKKRLMDFQMPKSSKGPWETLGPIVPKLEGSLVPRLHHDHALALY